MYSTYTHKARATGQSTTFCVHVTDRPSVVRIGTDVTGMQVTDRKGTAIYATAETLPAVASRWLRTRRF